MADVLIVDDDQSVSLTFAKMLSMAGHSVECLESGEAALARLRESRPDAVILDVRMPAMDGLDFLRQLRALPSCSTLPVGIVTGDYFLKEAVLDELAALGADVRYKPVWMDDLQTFVGGLLEGRHRAAGRSR